MTLYCLSTLYYYTYKWCNTEDYGFHRATNKYLNTLTDQPVLKQTTWLLKHCLTSQYMTTWLRQSTYVCFRNCLFKDKILKKSAYNCGASYVLSGCRWFGVRRGFPRFRCESNASLAACVGLCSLHPVTSSASALVSVSTYAVRLGGIFIIRWIFLTHKTRKSRCKTNKWQNQITILQQQDVWDGWQFQKCEIWWKIHGKL